jgi:glucose-6-phosphate 1-dehydrogenase
MTKESRTLAFTAVAATCLAFLFIYSWRHTGPPIYLPSGKRLMGPTVPLGAALLCFLVSLLRQLRDNK